MVAKSCDQWSHDDYITIININIAIIDCMCFEQVGFTDEGKLNGIIIDIYDDMGWNNNDSGGFGLEGWLDNGILLTNVMNHNYINILN